MTDIIVKPHDSVHNKVYAENLGVTHELQDFFTFQVPNYKFMPAFKEGIWDGKIKLYNGFTKTLYVGLTPYLEQFCEERNYTLSSFQDDPGTHNTEDTISHVRRLLEEQDIGLEEKEYQIQAIDHCIKHSRATIVSPTASGKSFIIYSLIRHYNVRTLIVGDTTGLIHQMYGDFQDYGFDSENNMHKIYSGQPKTTNKLVTMTTWQSVYKFPKKWFDQFDMIIGDEVHLFQAKCLKELMEKTGHARYKFGFTGTLSETKTHQLVIEGLFGPAKKIISTKELMDQGHISDVSIKMLVLNYQEDIRKDFRGLKYQQEIDKLISLEPRNKFIRNLALSLEGNTLVLFQFVEKHGEYLYKDIKANSDPDRKVFFIHGQVDGKVRNEIRAIVENETNAVIVASYQTLAKGVNIKNLTNLIIASPAKGKIRVLQSIGRILRLFSGKKVAKVYDIADNMTWKKTTNYALKHAMERMRIYASEKFKYKVYEIDVK